MAHIYQPVMLMELLASEGELSVSEIAAALLSHDRSQVEYYEQITKYMVGNLASKKYECQTMICGTNCRL